TGKPRWLLQISASGVETEGALEAYLDGEQLSWNTSGTLDRAFSTWEGTDLKMGYHQLVFKQGLPPADDSPIRQLCSITMHEFAAEPAYHKDDPSYIGAFPVWDWVGGKTFRPMNDFCLMRNMSSSSFCPICIEGLWLNLLKRLSFIDGIRQDCSGSKPKVHLDVLPLAQFRPDAHRFNETYIVSWYRDGTQMAKYDNQFDIKLPSSATDHSWSVRVQFLSSEIRAESDFLESWQEFPL
ncbi:hypothetical protein HDU91_003638, partial [Kappamyces sp. JEL0680]